MAKKRRTSETLKSMYYLILIAFILLSLLTLLNFLGIVNIDFLDIDLSGVLGGIGLNITLPPSDYNPPSADDCTEYNIAQQYRNAYGDASIDSFRVTCNSFGGVWTERSNEISCYWNPALAVVDCNDAPIRIFEGFCEDSLLSIWTCDNSLAFLGCTCNVGLPNEWNTGDGEEGGDDGGDDDGQEEYNPNTIGTMFVTNTLYSGALGGISGADAKCMFAVTYSDLGLNGEWIAIISDESTSAESRIPNGIIFYRVDGVMVAYSKVDLLTGNLDNPINLNENGNTPQGTTLAWTGSFEDGQIYSEHTCHNWGWANEVGITGLWTSTNGNWLNEYPFECTEYKHLYCMKISG